MKRTFRPYGSMLVAHGVLLAVMAGWTWAVVRGGGPWWTLIAPVSVLGMLLVKGTAPFREYEVDGEGITAFDGFRRRHIPWRDVTSVGWLPAFFPRLRISGTNGISVEIRGGETPEWTALLTELRRYASVPDEPMVARMQPTGCFDWLFLFAAFAATVAGEPERAFQTMGVVGALGLLSRRFFARGVWTAEDGIAFLRWGRAIQFGWDGVRLGRADDAATEVLTPDNRMTMQPSWRRYAEVRDALRRRLPEE